MFVGCRRLEPVQSYYSDIGDRYNGYAGPVRNVETVAKQSKAKLEPFKRTHVLCGIVLTMVLQPVGDPAYVNMLVLANAVPWGC